MKGKISWLVLEAFIGLVLIGIGFITQIDYYSPMIFAMGCGLGVGDIVQIVRILYWQSPKHIDEYEARKREAHIDSVDERKQYLRMKSGLITCQIMIVILFLLALFLSVFRVAAWVIGMVAILFLMCCIVWNVAYRVMEKRL